MWARVGPLSHCRMLSRYCIMRASTPHTIAPHVTMPHPTLAHAPISIQPSLFQATHLILRTKVRFGLDERLHDLAVAVFCRQVQRCVLPLIYIYKYVYIYTSVEGDSAALGGQRRPRQDGGDAGGGKSGPLCARFGECLERDEAGC